MADSHHCQCEKILEDRFQKFIATKLAKSYMVGIN